MNQLQLSALIAKHTPPTRKRAEGHLKSKLQDAAKALRSKLWVNTVGMFFNHAGNPVRCGLAKGSGDLIGYRVDIIAPEMVGQKFARFVSVEVKKPGRDTTDKDHKQRQEAWRAVVVSDGGIGGIVRSEAELAALLK